MIHIATSGFSFKDWLGTVYPPDMKDREMMGYYEKALGFDCTELNFTYYSMPTQKTMFSLLERTSGRFQFLVRTHADMTHKIWTDESRSELRDNQYVFEQFRYGLDPLVRANRLGCVLVQFPTSFSPRPETAAYLKRCRTLLKKLPVAVEFRHAAWDRPETYALLKELNFGTCIVDEPKHETLMPYKPVLTSDIAYFRLHGRSAHWFGADKARRYDYLYSASELQEFLPDIRRLAESSRVTFVAFNNCHAGSAARNALMTKQFLGLIDQFTVGQKQAVEGRVESRLGGELLF